MHLVGRMVVGRDPACEISHDHALLSRNHAEFVTAGQVVTVRDLGSRNGIFVNGVRAVEHVLEAGDIVQIGPLRARYLVDDDGNTATPEVLDADSTGLFRNVFIPGPAPAADVRAAVPHPADDEDDEDETRILRAPRMPRPASPADRLAVSVDADDEAPTQFLAAPDARALVTPVRSAASAKAAAPAVVAPVRRSAAVPAAAPHGLGSFVFVPLLAMAAVILGSAGLPVLVWRRAALAGADATAASIPLLWLAVPVTIALISTVLVGAFINRRVVVALAAVERSRT